MDEADFSQWRDLRIKGARQFPLGFLFDANEYERAPDAQSLSGLREGVYHGVFADHILVGFCGFRPFGPNRIKHRAEIGPFFVDQAHQGKGAAQVLMGGVIALATPNGLSQLELFVDTQNIAAQRFYEKAGFEKVALIPETVLIEGSLHDDYFYRLRIAP